MTFKPTASIKLVIWDLDDTFWTGTLSEGEIELIERNGEIVKTLCDRGIMSSICSKNDFDPVRERLMAAGLWDYFIFPQVAFAPKGQAIMSIVEQANLRPDNVLFIDDNPVNLEEIRFLSPEMMTALPEDVLPFLLDLPETKGKDDRKHSRLNQYKQLEQKVNDFQSTSLSNVDFLRQCDIRVRFDYDVETHADRIIELVNRSNQLNFTKRRLDTEAAAAEFRDSLNRHDIFSAAVFASDKYGDHGLIGFYMMLKNERYHQLIHFVFSCRIMNMGLEQFVFEEIGRPAVDVVQPVSNDICYFDTVDWIEAMAAEDGGTSQVAAKRLVLLGSCDLTAVATYCSRDRAEYVNAVQDGVMTRYDDFGFVLNDAKTVAASTALDTMPCWNREDFARFHADVRACDILIVSLSAALKGAYLLTDDGVAVRVHPNGLGEYVDLNPTAAFLRRCSSHALDQSQRETLLLASLEELRRETGAAHTFLLGANTRDVDGSMGEAEQAMLVRYNQLCEGFCDTAPNWRYVSVDALVAKDALVDPRHYTRLGYFGLAEHMLAAIAADPAPAASPVTPADAAPRVDIAATVRAGRRLNRLHLFGPKSGKVAHVKRAVRLMPFANAVLRRVGRQTYDPAAILASGKDAA